MLTWRLGSLHLVTVVVFFLQGCAADDSVGESASGGSGAEADLGTGGKESNEPGGSSTGGSSTGGGSPLGGSSTGGSSTGGSSSGEEDCPFELEPTPETLLGDLNQKQVDALCNKVISLLMCSYSESFLCNQEALSTARDREDEGNPAEICKATEAKCLSEGSDTPEEWAECSGDIDFTLCPGTVAQYEQCVRETHEKGRGLTKLWSCDDVDEFFTWRDAQDRALPEVCAGLEECVF